MRYSTALLTALVIAAPFDALIGNSAAAQTGPLDRPTSEASTVKPGKPGAAALRPANDSVSKDPVAAQEELRKEVLKEQDELAKLDRDELEEKAEDGERGAQVVLAADFAKEATALAFAPAAANDALSDAARWYSMAASRGFPGAPSLDQAGVRFYPIRIQRERRP